MGLTSLQVCMDTSDWLQGTIPEDNGMDSSSSPSGNGGGDMLTCSSTPLLERRLRPPHDQALKCPRCDSTHTKFCYYNNYSLTQPRYFCKTCRRYWTKGGTLRNIPVGGGCRKNKKVSNNSKKSSSPTNNDHHHPHHQFINNAQNPGSSSSSPSDLRLSFPEAAQFSHLGGLFGNNNVNGGGGIEDFRYNAMLDHQNPRGAIDFMESKYDFLGGNSRNHDFMGNGEMGGMSLIGGVGDHMSGGGGVGHNFHGLGLSSPFGMSLDGNTSSGNFMDCTQRLMLPYNELASHENHDHHHQNGIDVKPNMTKLLALEWQDHHQGCTSEIGKDSFGYNNINGLGSWTGLMNGYGPPATNP